MGLSSKQVSSDGNGWNQALLESAKTLELPKTFPMKRQQQQQQQQQQQPEQLNCPRCDSTNTKFCYYNNYNKSQPRHFCKACKRHWTKGGTLRNVPVGGGRKNKRLKTSKNVSKTNITTTTTTPLIPNNNLLQAVSNSRVSCNDNISEGFYQQPCILPNTSTITFTSKGLNDEILLSTTETTSLGLSSQNHDYDQEIQIPYSNLGNFESNPCSISSTITSIQSPILYNFTNDHHPNNGGLEETMMNNDHDDHQPWTSSMHTTSSNNWSWDDFDKFVSVEDDLTMPWDDIDIKP